MNITQKVIIVLGIIALIVAVFIAPATYTEIIETDDEAVGVIVAVTAGLALVFGSKKD
jgi:uncharacterized membrane protein YraQ (UPF0718 family)